MQSSPTGRDEWFADGGARDGHGKLYGRITKAGERVFVLRYRDPEGRLVNWSLGRYDPKATGPDDASEAWVLSQSALSLGLARRKAAILSAMHASGVRDLRGHFARERQIADAAQANELARIEAEARARAAEVEADRRREEQAQAQRTEAERYNLRALLDAYVRHLERRGKSSAADARRLFANHVYGVENGPAGRPAREIEPRDVTTLLRRLTEAGKGRTAAKLRSYMRAAYALAFQAELNPDAPSEMVPFRIEANPVAPTASLSQYANARERTLSASELRAFLDRAGALPVAQADALRLALLLGGQRPAQLLRATRADVDLEAKTIALRDPKGKRAQARTHVLPLQGDALDIAQRLCAKAEAIGTPWLFTSADVDPDRISVAGIPAFVDGGDAPALVPLRLETVSAAVTGIAIKMVESKQARESFQMRDLRRTCETMLAALGISRDIRAQIQSHGLGGVQARHYDRHDYLPEKRRALQAWEARIGRIKRNEAEPGVEDLADARQKRRQRKA